jgi:hypothetical protein
MLAPIAFVLNLLNLNVHQQDRSVLSEGASPHSADASGASAGPEITSPAGVNRDP